MQTASKMVDSSASTGLLQILDLRVIHSDGVAGINEEESEINDR